MSTQQQQPPVPTATTAAMPGQDHPDLCNLIINYIPTPVTDHELFAMFSQFGELVSARVIVDRATGYPKGYGFVKYKNVEQAVAAMNKMNGYQIHGKRLKVSPARGVQAASIERYVSRGDPPPYPVPAGQPQPPPPQPGIIAAPVAVAPPPPEAHSSLPQFSHLGGPPQQQPISVVPQPAGLSVTAAAPAPPTVPQPAVGAPYSGPSFELYPSNYASTSPPTSTTEQQPHQAPMPPPAF